MAYEGNQKRGSGAAVSGGREDFARGEETAGRRKAAGTGLLCQRALGIL